VKKIILILGALILVISILQACKVNDEAINYETNWGEHSDSAVKRLKENNIDYKVDDGIIYIQKKDLNKAQDCCS
jgi:flagellar biosynthesis/type III secretory pathway M-ring protein FliF/YscJ